MHQKKAEHQNNRNQDHSSKIQWTVRIPTERGMMLGMRFLTKQFHLAYQIVYQKRGWKRQINSEVAIRHYSERI